MFRGNWRLIPAITVTSAALPRKKSRSLALDKALWNQPHCFMKLELKWKSLLALLLCAGSGGKSGSIPFSPSLVCCTRPPMWAKRGSATSWRGQIYSDACLARLKIAGGSAPFVPLARLGCIHAANRFASLPDAPSLPRFPAEDARSEEHTSELQSRVDLVCRLLLE